MPQQVEFQPVDGDALPVQHNAAARGSELDALTGAQLKDRRMLLDALPDGDLLRTFDDQLGVFPDKGPVIGPC